MRQIVPVLLLVLVGLGLAAPAAADGRWRHHGSDRVVLALAEEGWVETTTARVLVAVDSAITADQAASARGRIRATLAELVPGVSWRITRFERSRDASGLERWHLEAEARVPDAGVDGIQDRAKAQSRPGEQVTVEDVDFTPTLAEREAVHAELRSAIYARAKEELARLNRVYPDRSFRIRRIDFTGGAPRPEPYGAGEYGMARMAEAVAAPARLGGEEVAERVEVRALVVLAAVPPRRGRDRDDDRDDD